MAEAAVPEMPVMPQTQVVKRSISISGTFADIAVHPPLFDETVLILIFILPFCCLVIELLRRVSPCYIIEKRNRASMRASARSSASSEYNLEVGDVDASKLKYTDAQRTKDREEEMAIKKRAAAVVASK